MINEIIQINKERNEEKYKYYNPITGEGSELSRVKLCIKDFKIKEQWVPEPMIREPLIKLIAKYGSIKEYINCDTDFPCNEFTKEAVVKEIIKIRVKYDFEFWAFAIVKISNKLGGDDINFRLTPPQKKLLRELEDMRLRGLPIRIILLKARQWGGSTLVQIYIVWIQLVHMDNWGSVVAAQSLDQSRVIKGMYRKLIQNYPLWLLDVADKSSSLDLSSFENSTHHFKVTAGGKPVRNSIIGIGSAEKPDSLRGMPAACAHFSEVGVWKKTDGKTPEEIVTSVTSGIPRVANTVVVKESTAKGQGNYFHQEWQSAVKGESDQRPVFVAWFEITLYETKLNDKEKINLAQWLIDNKDIDNAPNSRAESGKYYWKLWNLGATLENIAWYIEERKSKSRHSEMASEYPSDPIEAFANSGQKVFNNEDIEDLRKTVKDPKYIGDIVADGLTGKSNFSNIRFHKDPNGCMQLWEEPICKFVSNAYVVIVDVGGRSASADFSHICVISRIDMLYGGLPKIVADWHGHIDHDMLAWLSVRIAKYFDNALLVIESNTYESKDQNTDGDQTEFILNKIASYYSNIYARYSDENVVERVPMKYGFHTNRSTKPMIISNLVAMIREKSFIERNEQACLEYGWYEKKQNGSFGAIDGQHDDILMTRAIGLHVAVNEMDPPKEINIKTKINKRDSQITEASL